MLVSRAVSAATLVFTLPDTNFENSAVTSTGSILLTTADTGSLLELFPNEADPYVILRATFGDASVLGITAIKDGEDGADRYAVAGGVPSADGDAIVGYVNNTIWTVGLYKDTSSNVKAVVTIPEAQLLDGLAPLIADPNVVLVSDALAGVVYRVDTNTGAYKVVKEDPLFRGAPGVNGLKIVGDWVYFVNSETGDFGRWLITHDGESDGDVVIIAKNVASDDFQLAVDGGSAYLTRQVSPFDVFRVFSDGSSESIAEPPPGTTGRPTSVVLDPNDRTVGYFTTTVGDVYKWTVPYTK